MNVAAKDFNIIIISPSIDMSCGLYLRHYNQQNEIHQILNSNRSREVKHWTMINESWQYVLFLEIIFFQGEKLYDPNDSVSQEPQCAKFRRVFTCPPIV